MPERKKETSERTIPEAGKGSLDDELLPSKGTPVPQESTEGDVPDTAGKHGRMAPESAKGLEREREKEER